MDNSLLEQLQHLAPEFREKECLPDRKKIISLLKAACSLLFPGFYKYKSKSSKECLKYIEETLPQQICAAFAYDCGVDCQDSHSLTASFLADLPSVKKILLTDIEALYSGDPAATSKEEIILCYPGFYAVFIHRIAHRLYRLNIPYLPRIMAEYAHSKTGIDIHPGATIGEYFCIDHGTGIVIGETSVLGHHVKLYQGVTIGAKSFHLDEEGNPVKGGKRHPDLGNYVVVYANATILGADTHIGDHSVIGANVWIISSVAANQKIYYKQNEKA